MNGKLWSSGSPESPSCTLFLEGNCLRVCLINKCRNKLLYADEGEHEIASHCSCHFFSLFASFVNVSTCLSCVKGTFEERVLQFELEFVWVVNNGLLSSVCFFYFFCSARQYTCLVFTLSGSWFRILCFNLHCLFTVVVNAWHVARSARPLLTQEVVL